MSGAKYFLYIKLIFFRIPNEHAIKLYIINSKGVKTNEQED